MIQGFPNKISTNYGYTIPKVALSIPRDLLALTGQLRMAIRVYISKQM